MPRFPNPFVLVSARPDVTLPLEQLSVASEKMRRNEALCGAFAYFALPSFTRSKFRNLDLTARWKTLITRVRRNAYFRGVLTDGSAILYDAVAESWNIQ